MASNASYLTAAGLATGILLLLPEDVAANF